MTPPTDAPRPALGELARTLAPLQAYWMNVRGEIVPHAGGAWYSRADVDARIAQLVALATGGAATNAAVMEAIELTIKVCDAHERERRPMEDRCVDYAAILATAKRHAAARSLTPERPADA